jgi:hypothetical protein
MFPSLTQRLATSLELTVAILLLCLSGVIQCNREPVVACRVVIASELILDALNKLRQLLVNVCV